jgi:hypothetical protein
MVEVARTYGRLTRPTAPPVGYRHYSFPTTPPSQRTATSDTRIPDHRLVRHGRDQPDSRRRCPVSQSVGKCCSYRRTASRDFHDENRCQMRLGLGCQDIRLIHDRGSRGRSPSLFVQRLRVHSRVGGIRLSLRVLGRRSLGGGVSASQPCARDRPRYR